MTRITHSIELLRSAYEQGGFVRIKMEHRQRGKRTGWELRLPTRADAGVLALKRALRMLGFEYGSAYTKRKRKIIPIYGREQVKRFLDLIRPAAKKRIPRLPDRKDMRFKPKRRLK